MKESCCSENFPDSQDSVSILRNEDAFQSDLSLRIGLTVFFVLSIFLAFYTGFRVPNIWTTMHSFPCIQEGFYRRTVVGSLMFYLPDQLRYNYNTWKVVALGVTTTLVFVFLALFAQVHNVIARVYLIVFFLTGMGGFFFHTTGFLEHFLVLLSFLIIFLVQRGRLILASTLFPVCLFVHELHLLFTFPIVVTVVLARTKSLQKAILFCLPAALGTLLLFQCQTTSEIAIANLAQKVQLNANFRPRDDFWNVFRTSFTTYYQLMYDLKYFRLLLPLYLLHSLLLMGAFSHRIQQKMSAQNIVLCASVFFCTLMPLFLGLLGWDVARWFFLSLYSSFLLVILLSDKMINPRFGLLSCLCLTLIGIIYQPGYFDWCGPRQNAGGDGIYVFFTEGLPKEIYKIPDN